MEIREAVLSDYDDIFNATLACARESENIELNHKTVERGVRDILGHHTINTYFVVIKDGKFAACCWVMKSWWSDWKAKNYWLLETIFVLPEFRRMGITTLLIEYLMDLVNKQDDVAQLRLVVDEDNKGARNCYLKAGFKKMNYELMYMEKSSK